MARGTVAYKREGLLERYSPSNRSYEWKDAFYRVGESGRLEYPPVTKREAQRQARSEGQVAVFSNPMTSRVPLIVAAAAVTVGVAAYVALRYRSQASSAPADAESLAVTPGGTLRLKKGERTFTFSTPQSMDGWKAQEIAEIRVEESGNNVAIIDIDLVPATQGNGPSAVVTLDDDIELPSDVIAIVSGISDNEVATKTLKARVVPEGYQADAGGEPPVLGGIDVKTPCRSLSTSRYFNYPSKHDSIYKWRTKYSWVSGGSSLDRIKRSLDDSVKGSTVPGVKKGAYAKIIQAYDRAAMANEAQILADVPLSPSGTLKWPSGSPTQDQKEKLARATATIAYNVSKKGSKAFWSELDRVWQEAVSVCAAQGQQVGGEFVSNDVPSPSAYQQVERFSDYRSFLGEYHGEILAHTVTIYRVLLSGSNFGKYVYTITGQDLNLFTPSWPYSSISEAKSEALKRISAAAA